MEKNPFFIKIQFLDDSNKKRCTNKDIGPPLKQCFFWLPKWKLREKPLKTINQHFNLTF
jgi:hypothetical protein